MPLAMTGPDATASAGGAVITDCQVNEAIRRVWRESARARARRAPFHFLRKNQSQKGSDGIRRVVPSPRLPTAG